VQLAGGRGLLFQLQRLRHGRLHAEGQLVRLDAGPQRLVVGVVDAGQPVQLPQHAELGLLVVAANAALVRRDEQERFLALDLEAAPRVLRAEVTGAVGPAAAAAVAGRRAEDDVLRQVLVERSQAVADPRADRRVGPLAGVPAGVPGE